MLLTPKPLEIYVESPMGAKWKLVVNVITRNEVTIGCEEFFDGKEDLSVVASWNPQEKTIYPSRPDEPRWLNMKQKLGAKFDAAVAAINRAAREVYAGA